MIWGALAGWRDITLPMRQRVRRVLKDWQQHARPFEDTAYWAKRFLPFADVFAHTLPTYPVELYRAERTDIDNRYAARFTSWSRRPDRVEGFGWGQRRLVTAVFAPADILVDFVNLDLDTEGFQEVIVRPGHYNIIPWRLGWDRTGTFNVYAQPERARAQGYTLGGAPPDRVIVPTVAAPTSRLFHVTSPEDARAIGREGFRGGWGDVGFGVYFYDNLDDAMAYGHQGGWEHDLTQFVVLEATVPTALAAYVTPEPSWPNPEDYETVVYVELDQDAEMHLRVPVRVVAEGRQRRKRRAR